MRVALDQILDPFLWINIFDYEMYQIRNLRDILNNLRDTLDRPCACPSDCLITWFSVILRTGWLEAKPNTIISNNKLINA